MTFTSPLAPVDALSVAPEREALASWLESQRTELLSKLNGLTEEQAGRRVLGPDSLTTLHGIVRHLTKVEHVWFVVRLGGSSEPTLYGWPQDRVGDFRLDKSEGLEADVANYLAVCERSRKIFAELSLDETRVDPRNNEEYDVRWAMLHVIREYAQHNGHADIVRELIDGTTRG